MLTPDQVASYLNSGLSRSAQNGHVWSLSCRSCSLVSLASLWEHGQHTSAHGHSLCLTLNGAVSDSKPGIIQCAHSSGAGLEDSCSQSVLGAKWQSMTVLRTGSPRGSGACSLPRFLSRGNNCQS